MIKYFTLKSICHVNVGLFSRGRVANKMGNGYDGIYFSIITCWMCIIYISYARTNLL